MIYVNSLIDGPLKITFVDDMVTIKKIKHLYTHVLNITLGVQFVNLSPTIYSIASTNELCQHQE